jgi:hypothetical protein
MRATRFIVAVLACAALASCKWADSSNGIHTFLTFDSSAVEKNITAGNMKRVDFVWGATNGYVGDFQKANNATVASKYIPYARGDRRGTAGLKWYQKHRPSFVMYKCDRVTPAWSSFAGEKSIDLIPLDVSNPLVQQFQYEQYVLPAQTDGYDAMAWDNFELGNGLGACGAYRNGSWVQLYTGKGDDPAYALAQVAWLAAMKARVNNVTSAKGNAMLVIPNFSLPYGLAAPLKWLLGNATDGMLSESGISSGSCHPCLAGAEWESRVAWALHLQAHGKAYYEINEVGDVRHPKNWHTPCAADELNCITRRIREYLVATYLMLRNQAAGVFISGDQQYGHWPRAVCSPECDVPVGRATGAAVKNNTTGVWSREFTEAVVYINPTPLPSAAMTVMLNASYVYADAYGTAVNGAVILAGGDAVILTRQLK